MQMTDLNNGEVFRFTNVACYKNDKFRVVEMQENGALCQRFVRTRQQFAKQTTWFSYENFHGVELCS